MKRIYILCEGQAEQQFVQEVLYDAAMQRDIYLLAPLVATKIADKKFAGGVSTYSKIRNDLVKLCNHADAIVTSMFDLYKLPSNTPRYSPPPPSHYDWAAQIERAVNSDIGMANIRFNLIVHEFEALLYTEPTVFCDYSHEAAEMMERALAAASGNPETINNGFDTSPSHRILRAYPEYSKPATGVVMAKRIGLEKMRRRCLHFNEWLTSLGL